MPKKTIHGEGKRFQVISNWYQPQESALELTDGDKRVLWVHEDNKDVKMTQMFTLCDLLNELHEAVAHGG